MMLAPERDAQLTIEARTLEPGGYEVLGPVLAAFPVSIRPAGRPSAGSPVQLGPIDAMRYRRPPVTVSFNSLSQRSLPRTLFVNSRLPEGVTVCDVNGSPR